MSDVQYAQCIKLGSEVMEAQDEAYPDNSVKSSSKSKELKYQNKYDQWNRSCSLQALQRMGVNFQNISYPPSSPLIGLIGDNNPVNARSLHRPGSTP